MPVLKMDSDQESQEIEFELAYHRSLTLNERIAMLEERKIHFLKQLIDHEHRKPVEIIKRTYSNEKSSESLKRSGRSEVS
jgi:hypothetical protein